MKTQTYELTEREVSLLISALRMMCQEGFNIMTTDRESPSEKIASEILELCDITEKLSWNTTT